MAILLAGRRKIKPERLLLALGLVLGGAAAQAFPALLLGEGDGQAKITGAKVVVVRQGRKTVLTLAADVKTTATRLALILPAPGPLEIKQTNVADPGLVEALDAYAAPRLVVVKDPTPCPVPEDKKASEQPRVVGVNDGTKYDQGEYDFDVLNGKETAQLKTRLTKLGLKLAKGGEAALKPYLKGGAALVIAMIRLKATSDQVIHLRPVQLAYESDAFDLPLKLGAPSGAQAKDGPDLTIYAVTDQGRVEPSSGATFRAPSGDELPGVVALDPGRFYHALLGELARKKPATPVLEYAWPGTWCEPCAAEALTPRAWRKLGVFWIDSAAAPTKDNLRRQPLHADAKLQSVFVSRLHLVYGEKPPKTDPAFLVTNDQNNFQTRFVVREPFRGAASCESAAEYVKAQPKKREAEAQTLARLTGWDLSRVRREMGAKTPPATKGKNWVDDLWKD